MREESSGLGGPDSIGGLLMLIGGSSPFGIGVVGSWGSVLGSEEGKVGALGGGLDNGLSGLGQERGPPVFFLLGLGVVSPISDLLLGLRPLPWPKVFLLSHPFAWLPFAPALLGAAGSGGFGANVAASRCSAFLADSLEMERQVN